MLTEHVSRVSLGRRLKSVGVASALAMTLGVGLSIVTPAPAFADGSVRSTIEADSAATATDVEVLHLGLFCNDPLLTTTFGPLYSCNRVASSPVGAQVQAGFYSPITQKFTAETGWRPLVSHEIVTVSLGSADGGGRFISSHAHSTQFGPVYYGTQHNCFRGEGRFGTWSPFTRRFNASSGWLPITKGQSICQIT